ncbi:MAG: hypothetical protein WEE89_01415 [Gemmatimonadota bacterium]
MATRSETISVPESASTQEIAREHVRQRRPMQERFWLQVDRQTKASFTTIEAAEKAGLAIKKAHPIVQVAVYDAAESTNKLIETR